MNHWQRGMCVVCTFRVIAWTLNQLQLTLIHLHNAVFLSWKLVIVIILTLHAIVMLHKLHHCCLCIPECPGNTPKHVWIETDLKTLTATLNEKVVGIDSNSTKDLYWLDKCKPLNVKHYPYWLNSAEVFSTLFKFPINIRPALTPQESCSKELVLLIEWHASINNNVKCKIFKSKNSLYLDNKLYSYSSMELHL